MSTPIHSEEDDDKSKQIIENQDTEEGEELEEDKEGSQEVDVKGDFLNDEKPYIIQAIL